MFLESGMLPIGVRWNGKMRREYSLRPLKIKDSMAVRRSADAERCKDDDELMGLALLGRRLEIEEIPAEAMDLGFMEELFDQDMEELMQAEGRLEKQIARFRGEAEEAADPGPSQDRDALGDGAIDAAERGLGMAGGMGRPEESKGWPNQEI